MVMSHAREHLCPGAFGGEGSPDNTIGMAVCQSLLNHHKFTGRRHASVAAMLSVAGDSYM